MKIEIEIPEFTDHYYDGYRIPKYNEIVLTYKNGMPSLMEYKANFFEKPYFIFKEKEKLLSISETGYDYAIDRLKILSPRRVLLYKKHITEEFSYRIGILIDSVYYYSDAITASIAIGYWDGFYILDK